MSLPSAPPAFDASGDTGADRRADVATAVGLFLLEGAVLFAVLGAWLLTGVSLSSTGTLALEPDRPGGYLVAAGTVGLLAVLAVVVAIRGRAVVTAWSQGLMVVLIAAAVCWGPGCPDRKHEVRQDRKQPAPASTWQGQVACRSGGDSDECATTGR
ncbi:DUF6234 family protein [Streptomyces flavofungini]|uniref:DUF6234 domain-containing protein n=1 Tax=Streptomyces flavofungini TaxID=68200 RepID=A0ABS0XEM8_9ACTN|nr:DUF6234 family protein [Streptomyces flavofungini]MBJ3811629.1 hypothetical protein [Streptomyces flavofungini]